MNTLPSTSVATRLSALAAAAAVTLMLLSGIDTLARGDGAAPLLVHAAVVQPA